MASANQPTGGIADLYQLHALGFAHPVEELHEQLVNGGFQRNYDARLQTLGWRPAGLPLVKIDFSRFEADYITLFQVGGGGHPPCSICETDYELGDGPRGEQLVELTRFYRNFGLRPTTDAEENEQPDHLVCELDLMAFLCFREADAYARRVDGSKFRRAQQDFLTHRLGRWTPVFVDRVVTAAGAFRIDPIFAALARALGDMVRQHQAHLRLASECSCPEA